MLLIKTFVIFTGVDAVTHRSQCEIKQWFKFTLFSIALRTISKVRHLSYKLHINCIKSACFRDLAFSGVTKQYNVYNRPFSNILNMAKSVARYVLQIGNFVRATLEFVNKWLASKQKGKEKEDKCFPETYVEGVKISS